MELKELILTPIVERINASTNRSYGIDDFYMLRVDDPLKGSLKDSGTYAGETRCMYDMLTVDPNGLRVRITIKPDSFTSMEPLIFDTYGAEDFDDNRSVYSSTFRLNSEKVGLVAGATRCPDLTQLYLQGCEVLTTEGGELIIGNNDLYFLREGSNCGDPNHT